MASLIKFCETADISIKINWLGNVYDKLNRTRYEKENEDKFLGSPSKW